jgi:hypothetical protein
MKTKDLFMMGILLQGFFLVTGCVWDNEEELYPETAICDTTSVSYSKDIVPILSNNCYSCHSDLNAFSFGGGIGFEDHQNVAGYAERIIGAINHDKGFVPMPQNGEKLDSCSINLFEAWTNSDTPLN